MRIQKQRKRMTVLMVGFLLTFLVGAAFAFSPGQLTIGGTVSLDPNYVVWNTVNVMQSSPAAVNVLSQTAIIEDARGRTDQHVRWEISFRSAGTARLDVTALNEHETLSAAVAIDVTSALTSAEFGLSIGGNFNQNLPEVIAPGQVGLSRYVTVTWDGTVPPGFDQDNENPVFDFIISFNYTAAP